jgi:hypothetical protein
MTVPGYRHEGVRAEKQKDRQHCLKILDFDGYAVAVVIVARALSRI